MLCALAVGVADTCNGDTGGPLVAVDPTDRWRVLGITSWGYGCGNGLPSVYARAAGALAWCCPAAPIALPRKGETLPSRPSAPISTYTFSSALLPVALLTFATDRLADFYGARHKRHAGPGEQFQVAEAKDPRSLASPPPSALQASNRRWEPISGA